MKKLPKGKEKEGKPSGATALFRKVGDTLLTAGGTIVDISTSIGGIVGGGIVDGLLIPTRLLQGENALPYSTPFSFLFFLFLLLLHPSSSSSRCLELISSCHSGLLKSDNKNSNVPRTVPRLALGDVAAVDDVGASTVPGATSLTGSPFGASDETNVAMEEAPSTFNRPPLEHFDGGSSTSLLPRRPDKFASSSSPSSSFPSYLLLFPPFTSSSPSHFSFSLGRIGSTLKACECSTMPWRRSRRQCVRCERVWCALRASQRHASLSE